MSHEFQYPCQIFVFRTIQFTIAEVETGVQSIAWQSGNSVTSRRGTHRECEHGNS